MKKNFNIILIAVLFSAILWISITLSDEYYSTYKVPLRVIDAPTGYTVASELPSDILIKIKGIGWRLTGLSLGSESHFNVSAKNDSGKILSNLFANIVENQWLSSDISVIDISPDTVSFIIERIINKKVPVKPELDITFKPGFGLGSKLTVNPDTVTVFGPKNIINSLEEIRTSPIELTRLDTRTKVKAGFNNNKIRTDISSVEVLLDVQRIVDKTIDNIRVDIIDVPSDRDVVLLPNTVSCIVKGGVNILGKLKLDDFNAYIHYKDVLLDTLGSVRPVIELPENVELISQRPDRLRYVIKKFN